MLKQSALAAAAILLLSGTAFGSTVTLTGSCPFAVVNSTNPSIAFNLSNSGDGVASALTVSPIIKGALTYNSSIYLSELLPGQSSTMHVQASNLTAPGDYVDYFVTRYSQGDQTFVTVFPCLAAMQSASQSMVDISNVTTKGRTVSVSLYNGAAYPVNVSAALEVPPSFNVDRPTTDVLMQPGSGASVSFNISVPQYTNATFPISFSASYSNNGIHYSELRVVDYSTSPQPVPGSPIRLNIAEIGFMVAIVAVLCLISVSIARKRVRPASQQKDNIGE
ncbi:MAG: hypothetical protein KGH58_04320 [Candidatus Micrarchaeota archaeon]|nr:hypothetical protein [Candidatus Micrarchaeota archaeon]